LDTMKTALGIFLAAAAVGLPVVGVVKLASASGEADFCYVRRYGDFDSVGFRLHANVPWGDDRIITRVDTFEEAVAAAERIGCPLR
jgi:hypothetical protein